MLFSVSFCYVFGDIYPRGHYIDKIMSTSFGPDLIVPSFCSDAPSQTFRDARHQTLCENIKGQVIKSDYQQVMISPVTLINHSLLKWQNHALGDSMNHRSDESSIHSSKEMIDMAAYCYSYHMDGG